jgi:hypothetical protein
VARPAALFEENRGILPEPRLAGGCRERPRVSFFALPRQIGRKQNESQWVLRGVRGHSREPPAKAPTRETQGSKNVRANGVRTKATSLQRAGLASPRLAWIPHRHHFAEAWKITLPVRSTAQRVLLDRQLIECVVAQGGSYNSISNLMESDQGEDCHGECPAG